MNDQQRQRALWIARDHLDDPRLTRALDELVAIVKLCYSDEMNPPAAWISPGVTVREFNTTYVEPKYFFANRGEPQ